MDVNNENFWRMLPIILEAAMDAVYVALDLEMTGVCFKRSSKAPKPTVEEIYQQAKEGATAFQILQLGLCFIRYDREAKAYISRTFNIFLTPMFVGTDPVDRFLSRVLDRTVSFSSSSLAFLRSHGFQLEKAFSYGVPYLSREELEESRQVFIEHRQPGAGPIDLAGQQPETRTFYSDVRARMVDWIHKSNDARTVMNIRNPKGGRLNRLQITLIRQLIQTEFPGYQAYAKNGDDFMQISKIGPGDEEFLKLKKAKKQEAVMRQAGFYYIFAALAGADFADDIDAEWLIPGYKGAYREAAVAAMQADLKRYETQLKNKQPILVGHNQFFDLCFLYRTFVGSLPETLEAFIEEIRRFFPRIVDTKYIATRGNDEMSPIDNLEELFKSVRHQEKPRFLDEDPFCYTSMSPHQAGFDSWMTGVVFVNLSWKLSLNENSLRRIPGDDDQEATDGDGDGLASPNSSAVSSPTKSAFADLNPFAILDSSRRRSLSATYKALAAKASRQKTIPPTTTSPVARRPQSPANDIFSGTSNAEPSTRAATQPLPGLSTLMRPLQRETQTAYSPKNDQYSSLASESEYDQAAKSQACRPGGAGYLASTIPPRRRSEQHGTAGNPDAAGSSGARTSPATQPLPEWDSEFWQLYGNKLRVGNSGVVTLR